MGVQDPNFSPISPGQQVSAAWLNALARKGGDVAADIAGMLVQGGNVNPSLLGTESWMGKVGGAPSTGIADYTDDRYWVIRCIPDPSITNPASALVISVEAIPGIGQSIVAHNMSEWKTLTHGIPFNTPVLIHAIWNRGNPSAKLFFFQMTPPTVQVTITGGANPYTGNITQGVANAPQLCTYINDQEPAGNASIAPGTNVDGEVTLATTTAIQVNGSIDMQWIGYVCAGAVVGGSESVFNFLDAKKVDFNLAAQAPGTRRYVIGWNGIELNLGGYSGAGFLSQVKIITFSAATMPLTPDATNTTYPVKFDFGAPSTASRDDVTCADAVNDGTVFGKVVIPNQTWMTIEDCGGSVIGTMGGVQTLKFGNGLTVRSFVTMVGPPPVTDPTFDIVELNIAGDNTWITVADAAGSCLGKLVSHIGPGAAGTPMATLKITTGTGTITFTPELLAWDAKGHVVSIADGTPVTFTTSTYMPPTWTGDTWISVDNTLHTITHIGPGAAANHYVTSTGSGYNITPYKVDTDAKGHVVGTTADTPFSIPKPSTLTVTKTGTTITVTLTMSDASTVSGSLDLCA